MNERLDIKTDLDTSSRTARPVSRDLDRDAPRREAAPGQCPNCGLDTGARGWRYVYPTH